jgi:hypothetical protein
MKLLTTDSVITFRIPSVNRNILVSAMSRVYCLMGIRVLFQGIKQPGGEADHFI